MFFNDHDDDYCERNHPLANHKSALKRSRQSEDRRLRNKAVKTRVKSVTKSVRKVSAENSTEAVAPAFKNAQSNIDKAAKKGVLHKRTAARKVSRLAKLANSAQS
jgi:small subunit ribosomal protein S20